MHQQGFDGWSVCTGGRRGKTSRCSKKYDHETEFPTLGETVQDPADLSSSLDYAVAVKTEEPKQDDREEVEPGWVKMKRDPKTNRTVQIGGTPPQPYDEAHARDVALEKLVNRWQSERDQLNAHLDQASPYWGVKSLREPLSDAEYSDTDEESDIESDDGMDSDCSGGRWDDL